MGTTATPNYDLIKPNPFEEDDTWGPILNTNWDKVDTQMKVNADAIAAKADKAYVDSQNAAQDTVIASKAAITYVDSENDAQDTVIAAKADKTYVDSQNSAQDAVIATKAPLDSPAFTGTPTAPTPADGDNDTSVANSAFVQRALGISPIVQIGGNVTIGPTHLNGATLLVTVAGVVITIPDDQTAIPIGTRIDVINWDSGATTTFSPGAGVGLGSPDSKRRITKAYAAASLTKVGANLWNLVGELVT